MKKSIQVKAALFVSAVAIISSLAGSSIALADGADRFGDRQSAQRDRGDRGDRGGDRGDRGDRGGDRGDRGDRGGDRGGRR